MYTCFNCNKLSSVIRHRLDNYKLHEDPEIDTSNVLVYSYQEILRKKFYDWHLDYFLSKKPAIIIFKLIKNKDNYNYKLFILPTCNKDKFANYLFSNDVIENSGLREL